jgi:hypothetical protein
MAKKLVPPYDLGPYETMEAAERRCVKARALGLTCEGVKRDDDGKFYCRVTKAKN